MSSRQSDPGRPSGAQPRRSGTHERGDGVHVPATRALLWIFVAVLVLVGIVLYFLYQRRMSPVLG